jgi:hypothetical protein
VNRRRSVALLYSAHWGQALSGRCAARHLISFAGPRFSSGSALWLSQHGTRRMRWSNLTRVLIAPGRDRYKSPSELTSSIVPRRTSFRLAAELKFERASLLMARWCDRR